MDFVSNNGNYSEQVTEIYVKKVLAGGVESVRLRLIDALEKLGYDIIEEEPLIIGRRGAKGWGSWYGSANVLDYPMTATVRLKTLGENSTRATFDYVIKSPMLTKGDKAIVLQEAKTIAAIAKIQMIERMCSVCETESTDDSRFCRRCGAPLTSENAELEVLRMMAEAHAGRSSVAVSSILMIVSMVLVTVVLLLNNAGMMKPKAFYLLLIFGGIGLLSAVILSLFGWNRLTKVLEKPAEHDPQFVPRHFPQSLETGEFDQLPAASTEFASVTEGTTNLLSEEWKRTAKKEKIPVAEKRETNSFD